MRERRTRPPFRTDELSVPVWIASRQRSLRWWPNTITACLQVDITTTAFRDEKGTRAYVVCGQTPLKVSIHLQTTGDVRKREVINHRNYVRPPIDLEALAK